MGIIAHKRQKTAGDDGPTRTLKLKGRVIRSPQRAVPIAPQNGLRFKKKFKKRKEKELNGLLIPYRVKHTVDVVAVNNAIDQLRFISTLYKLCR